MEKTSLKIQFSNESVMYQFFNASNHIWIQTQFSQRQYTWIRIAEAAFWNLKKGWHCPPLKRAVVNASLLGSQAGQLQETILAATAVWTWPPNMTDTILNLFAKFHRCAWVLLHCRPGQRLPLDTYRHSWHRKDGKCSVCLSICSCHSTWYTQVRLSSTCWFFSSPHLPFVFTYFDDPDTSTTTGRTFATPCKVHPILSDNGLTK